MDRVIKGWRLTSVQRTMLRENEFKMFLKYKLTFIAMNALSWSKCTYVPECLIHTLTLSFEGNAHISNLHPAPISSTPWSKVKLGWIITRNGNLSTWAWVVLVSPFQCTWKCSLFPASLPPITLVPWNSQRKRSFFQLFQLLLKVSWNPKLFSLPPAQREWSRQLGEDRRDRSTRKVASWPPNITFSLVRGVVQNVQKKLTMKTRWGGN